MFLFQATATSPVQLLNRNIETLEARILEWRDDPKKAATAAVAAAAIMGDAVLIIKDKGIPEKSPQFQLALRALMLAKRAMEELVKQGFNDAISEAGNKTPQNLVDLFGTGGALKETANFQNAAFQDTYFKNYFALLFSPSFKTADKLSVIRLANALTDAAYVRSAAIKMPFNSEKDAQAFADFAKNGGIPYCKVLGEPAISDSGFGNQKIVVFSISYAPDYLPAATDAPSIALPEISNIKQYTITPLSKSDFSRTGVVYGDAPSLAQLKARDNASSSQQKKTPYSFFAEFQYAEKFNEANIGSKASAKDAFIMLINDYMKYMGISLDVYNPPELATFFNSKDGTDFLREFKQIYESGNFIGSATVENRGQVGKNEALGGKRADLFQKVANEVLNTYKVADEYLLSPPAQATKAVSVWDNENEVIKSWVDRFAAQEKVPGRAEYSQLAQAILFGDYAAAKELNSSLKVFGPEFFASISKEKAALAKNDDQTYKINNPALLERLLARCDLGVGLRFEGDMAQQAKKGAAASTNRQQFGAFFVDVALEPDRGVRFTTSDMDTKVEVNISNSVRDGEKVTADITVFVEINGKDRLFLENSANRIIISGQTEGGIITPESISDFRQVEVNGRKAVTYTATFSSKDNIYIQANAHKGDLESGWAWQTVPAEVRKPEPVKIIPKSIKAPPRAIPTTNPIPLQNIGVNSLFLPVTLGQSSNTSISNALSKAYLSLGATYAMGPGTWVFPEMVEQSQFNSFVNTLTTELSFDPNFSQWCRPGVTPEQVVAALMKSDKVALQGLLTEEGYNSIGELSSGKSQKVRIENASALVGVTVITDVTISKVIALTKAKPLGVAFKAELGQNPFKLKGAPDLSKMEPGSQLSFIVDGKKYLAVCEKQDGGDVVGVFRTPMPLSLILALNNKGLLVYDKFINATSANATIVGSILLKNLEISPSFSAGATLPTNKSVLKGEGKEFYLNYSVGAGVSSKYAFSKTLKAGLDFGIQHIMAPKLSPSNMGQITVSLEKSIPNKAVSFDVNIGENFFQHTSPTYFAGAGIEVGKKSRFILGAKWNVSAPYNIKKGTPEAYFNFIF